MTVSERWGEREMNCALTSDTYDDYVDMCREANTFPRTRVAWWSVRKRVKQGQSLSLGDNRPEPAPRPEPTGKRDWDATLRFLESDDDDTEHERLDSVSRIFTDNRPIGIAFFSDLHIGAKILYRRLYEDLVLLRDTDGLFGVINGDILENTKPSLKSAPALYTARITSPAKQLSEAEHFLGIPHKHKIMVLMQGNHDAFDFRVAGIDRIEGLARTLDVPYFTERGGSIHVMVSGQRYLIVAKHDYAGKSRINKSNSARRLWDEFPREWQNADIIALAHLHEPDVHQTTRKGQPVIYLRSGTYKTHDEWAEAAGYLPAYGVPVVILYPGERKMIPFPPQNYTDAVEFLRRERTRHGKAEP